MVEVMIAEMFGSDGICPTDYKRAVVVEAEVKRNNEDHSQSEWRSTLKKGLTGPALLEKSGYSATGG